MSRCTLPGAIGAEKTFAKTKGFNKKQSREVDTDEDLGNLEHAFQAVDPFKRSRSFLNDVPSSSQPPRPENKKAVS